MSEWNLHVPDERNRITQYKCGLVAGQRVRLKKDLDITRGGVPTGKVYHAGQEWVVLTGITTDPVLWFRRPDGERHTWDDDAASVDQWFESSETMSAPNEPAVANPGIASRFHGGCHWRGVADTERWAQSIVTMNKFIASVILTTFSTIAFGQGVLLSPGESYVFGFTSLPYVRPVDRETGQFAAYFAAGTFSDSESVLVEIFPDTLSDTPLSTSYTHSGPANPLESVSVAFAWMSDSPPYWPDLQGVTRVTMLSGDAELLGFGARQIINGGVYSQFFAVPEPSGGVLFAVGSACAVMLRLRRRKSPKVLERTGP